MWLPRFVKSTRSERSRYNRLFLSERVNNDHCGARRSVVSVGPLHLLHLPHGIRVLYSLRHPLRH